MKSSKKVTLDTLNLAIQNLVTIQRNFGVGVHQLARNPFSMKRTILATFMLHNPKKVQFPDIGLTAQEILSIIKTMNFRVTEKQVLAELQNLKAQGDVTGCYYEDSGRAYVWSICG